MQPLTPQLDFEACVQTLSQAIPISEEEPMVLFQQSPCLSDLNLNLPRCVGADELLAVEQAASETARVPLELSTYDARPRWIAVSLTHHVEFARFCDDQRVQYWFNDDYSQPKDWYTWRIEPEPRLQREARLRHIFGAFVCGDTLPNMQPWVVDAYELKDPAHDMKTSITESLEEIAAEIKSVPFELREPEYLHQEREQEEVHKRDQDEAHERSRKRTH